MRRIVAGCAGIQTALEISARFGYIDRHWRNS
jgi:hypothetical protein